MDANILAASKDPKDLKQTSAQTRTTNMDANILAATKDPNDLKQTSAQSRYTFIHFLLTRYACISVTLYNGAYSCVSYLHPLFFLNQFCNKLCFTIFPLDFLISKLLYHSTLSPPRTTYLDANVHAASMDTKDLKQTPTQYRYTFIHFTLTRYACSIVTLYNGVIGKNGGISSEVLNDLNPSDERTEIRNTTPPDFIKSIETEEITSLREKGNLNKDDEASLSENLSDTFINIILPVQAD
ncbi:hypothetical protein H5410_062111 [Solanum commersonii]|uniref:Uncharacterized protein n=1 Tax=Solanum commersonii TaxID=4109 RepID=A0A9J5W9T6_SOLCO|nr:hypothetical protein H5410_062111 [Solanum commersonii]